MTTALVHLNSEIRDQAHVHELMHDVSRLEQAWFALGLAVGILLAALVGLWGGA